MKIELAPIESITPYARNPRKNEHAVAKVAASMREFGVQQPIVVDKNRVIIVGHTRLLAALQLGLTEVPVVVAAGLSDAQAKAYRLMDNRSHEEAEWDKDLLKLELGDLREWSFDMALTGFSPKDLAALGADGLLPGADPDAIPKVPSDPVTRLGDVIEFGRHRLVCGDATDPAAVAALLGQERPSLMVTDPPYGVDYDPAWRDVAAQKGQLSYGLRRTGAVRNDDRMDWGPAWALFPGEVAYVWHASAFCVETAGSLSEQNFEIRSQLIWAKPQFAISRGHYHWQHEACWYAVRRGATADWIGDRSQSTLWEIASPHLTAEDAGLNHGTPKPIECMERPLRNHGGDVYDPFAGTGTTAIAAERQGRRAFLMEVDPGYCDCIIERWERATGGEAKRL